MKIKASATLINGITVSGWLTTEHAASSYGQPVFADENNQAYDWVNIVDISTAAELGKRGGSVTSEAKTAAARKNARKGGWPKGRPRKAK